MNQLVEHIITNIATPFNQVTDHLSADVGL